VAFKKGDPNINRLGRPRKPEIEMLREALEKVKVEKGLDFIEHFVRMAYTHKEVAIALAKKLLPDRIEGEGFGDRYTFIQGGQQVDPVRMSRLAALLRARASEGRPSQPD